MVGATGFEPATSCSRSRRATGLRYAPPTHHIKNKQRAGHAPGESRTPNLLIRSQMLYPVELRALNDSLFRQASRPSGQPPSMGGTRLELVTSTMSTWRSNQLS